MRLKESRSPRYRPVKIQCKLHRNDHGIDWSGKISNCLSANFRMWHFTTHPFSSMQTAALCCFYSLNSFMRELWTRELPHKKCRGPVNIILVAVCLTNDNAFVLGVVFTTWVLEFSAMLWSTVKWQIIFDPSTGWWSDIKSSVTDISQTLSSTRIILSNYYLVNCLRKFLSFCFRRSFITLSPVSPVNSLLYSGNRAKDLSTFLERERKRKLVTTVRSTPGGLEMSNWQLWTMQAQLRIFIDAYYWSSQIRHMPVYTILYAVKLQTHFFR